MNLTLVIVLAGLNAWTFGTFAVDKRRANRDKPRVAEAQLLLLAAVGGALGAWLAVRVFRHKTRKTAFLLGLIVATVVAVLAWYSILNLLWQPADNS